MILDLILDVLILDYIFPRNSFLISLIYSFSFILTIPTILAFLTGIAVGIVLIIKKVSKMIYQRISNFWNIRFPIPAQQVQKYNEFQFFILLFELCAILAVSTSILNYNLPLVESFLAL